MAFQVPPPQVPHIKKLLELPSEKMDAFAGALGEVGPHFNIADLSTEMAKRMSMPMDVTHGIIGLLASLYLTKDTEVAPLDSFLDEQVFPALRRAKVFPEKDGHSEWPRLRKFLVTALRLEKTLGTAAKAGYVLTQHERIFVSARILTDIRPIFHLDVSEKPESAVLVHMLRITTRDQFGDSKDKYFALDSNDVRLLRGLVDRALKKEETLRDLMKNSGVTVLNPKETF